MLMYPLVTEKAMRLLETEGKISFIVDRRANKKIIRKTIKNMFDKDVEKINIMIDQKGRKKAIIKFKNPEDAAEIAEKLGVI